MAKTEKKQKNITDGDSFGGRLRFLRKKRDLSQVQLAKKLGYKRSGSISNIENGKTPPDIITLTKIADVLNADLHWLITGKASPGEQRLEKGYHQVLMRLAKYIARGLAQLLEDRDSAISQLSEAEAKQARGEYVEQEFIEVLKSEIRQTQSAISDLAEDQPWVDAAIKAIKKASPEILIQNNNSV